MKEGGGFGIVVFIGMIIISILMIINKVPFLKINHSGKLLGTIWEVLARGIIPVVMIVLSIWIIYQILKS